MEAIPITVYWNTLYSIYAEICICHTILAVEIGAEVGLRGNGYLELPRSLLPHRTSDQVMVLFFTTDQPDGLLVWQGQDELVGNGGDYLCLVLAGGYPRLHYELGGGPANLTLLHRVDDGNLHKIEVKRKGRRGEMVLDDTATVTGTSQVSCPQQQLLCHRDQWKKFIPFASTKSQ